MFHPLCLRARLLPGLFHSLLSISLMVPVGARAADSAASGSLASLNAEALDLDQSSRAFEDAQGDAGNLVVYVSSQARALLLRDITVRIDDAAPVHYQYSDVEGAALQRNALHRLCSVAAAPGPHRLRAEFLAIDGNDGSLGATLRGRIDQNFRSDPATGRVEIDLVKDNYLSSPTLKLRDGSAAP